MFGFFTKAQFPSKESPPSGLWVYWPERVTSQLFFGYLTDFFRTIENNRTTNPLLFYFFYEHRFPFMFFITNFKQIYQTTASTRGGYKQVTSNTIKSTR